MAYRDTGHGHPHFDLKYIYVFFALCVFTGLSILLDVWKALPHPVVVVGVMAVAAAKGACVMLFFMHLKFEGKWKFILLAPTMILAVGLPLALMPDVAVHYYIKDVPQVGDYDQAMAHHPDGEHGGDGAENSAPTEGEPENQ